MEMLVLEAKINQYSKTIFNSSSTELFRHLLLANYFLEIILTFHVYAWEKKICYYMLLFFPYNYSLKI